MAQHIRPQRYIHPIKRRAVLAALERLHDAARRRKMNGASIAARERFIAKFGRYYTIHCAGA